MTMPRHDKLLWLKSPKIAISLFLLVTAGGLGIHVGLRAARGNFQIVVQGKVYRSAQPSPEQLKRWINRWGIRTVINLRGDDSSIVEKEKVMAAQLGVRMVSLSLSAHRLTSRPLMAELINAIETAQLPVLIHCQAGVDRAGTAAAMAAMAIGAVNYDKARWQAYVAPGPWKRRSFNDRRNRYPRYEHISDMLVLYQRYCTQSDIEPMDWQSLKDWISRTDALPEAEVE